MNKNRFTGWLAFSGLLLMLLFPRDLYAQTVSGAEGYDYDGKAIVSILPFTGEEKAAADFDRAVAGAVINLQKYSSRIISAGTVEAAGVRVPTDMPPVRELIPGARYALTGGVYPGSYETEYYLQLWLWDMRNSTMIYTDDLVYQNIDEGLQSLPGLVEWLFSHIIEDTVEDGTPPEKAWEDKLLTAGIRSGVSQRWYTASGETAPGARALNFEGGFFLSVRLNSLFSIQAEADFTFDNLVYRGVTDTGGEGAYDPVLENEKYTGYSLMFPLLFKANFRFGNFRIAPLAGIYAFLPLGKVSYRNPAGEEDSFSWSVPVPLGYMAGFEAAVKFGPGSLVADIRYAGDFSATTIQNTAGAGREDISYKRRILSFTLGYAFGFIDVVKKR
ncbi:MAG: PorT family protein [Spirochaetaceae bacterium]|jgi:hypothetical protein|nr:PorT family protein [Spirochaetaceae bacterium]